MFNRLRNSFTKKPPTTPTVAPTEDRGTIFNSDRLTKEETAKFEEAEKKEAERKTKVKEEEQRTGLVSYENANDYQRRYGWGGGKKSKSKSKSKKSKSKSKKSKSKSKMRK